MAITRLPRTTLLCAGTVHLAVSGCISIVCSMRPSRPFLCDEHIELDEMPSMQLTEALLTGLPRGPGERCGTDADHLQQGHEFDVSALDIRDVNEVLAQPDANSDMGCSPAPQQSNVLARQPAAQHRNHGHRGEGRRAQNREAQARYRKKAKVQSPRVLCNVLRARREFMAICQSSRTRHLR